MNTYVSDLLSYLKGSAGTVAIDSAMTIQGGTAWHSANDGSGSGLDADVLDGMQPTSASSGSTIVARDGSGNVSLAYVNMTADIQGALPSHYAAQGGDNWLRWYVTPAGGMVGVTAAQTLTNKTLTSPTINTPSIATPTISNPTISGTVSGSPTLTNPHVSGTMDIGGRTVVIGPSNPTAYHIESGSYTFTGVTTPATHTVNFALAFTAVPQIVLTQRAYGSDPWVINPPVLAQPDPTTGQFTIGVQSNSGSAQNITVEWMAFGS